MKKYEIIARTIPTGETKYVIRNNDLPRKPYFVEYNFMGGVDWDTDVLAAYYMDLDEAEQIKADLEDADTPVGMNPADKQYLVMTSIEDEPVNKIMKGWEVANLYEDDQLTGIYGDIKVWDISGDEPKRINLIDLVDPILENKRWMEQEYRDYCENERY